MQVRAEISSKEMEEEEMEALLEDKKPPLKVEKEEEPSEEPQIQFRTKTGECCLW